MMRCPSRQQHPLCAPQQRHDWRVQVPPPARGCRSAGWPPAPPCSAAGGGRHWAPTHGVLRWQRLLQLQKVHRWRCAAAPKLRSSRHAARRRRTAGRRCRHRRFGLLLPGQHLPQHVPRPQQPPRRLHARPHAAQWPSSCAGCQRAACAPAGLRRPPRSHCSFGQSARCSLASLSRVCQILQARPPPSRRRCLQRGAQQPRGRPSQTPHQPHQRLHPCPHRRCPRPRSRPRPRPPPAAAHSPRPGASAATAAGHPPSRCPQSGKGPEGRGRRRRHDAACPPRHPPRSRRLDLRHRRCRAGAPRSESWGTAWGRGGRCRHPDRPRSRATECHTAPQQGQPRASRFARGHPVQQHGRPCLSWQQHHPHPCRWHRPSKRA